MSKLIKLLMTTLWIGGFLVLSNPAYSGNQLKCDANLEGSQEVPPVMTDTSGEIKVKFKKHLTKAKFKLKVEDGDAITQAHFHCAPAGMNGPVVAFLFGNVPGGFDVDGRLARFTMTTANITAVGADCTESIGMAINNIADLASAMEMGYIYTNVHSVANPAGEIRGQLECGRSGDSSS